MSKGGSKDGKMGEVEVGRNGPRDKKWGGVEVGRGGSRNSKMEGCKWAGADLETVK